MQRRNKNQRIHDTYQNKSPSELEEIQNIGIIQKALYLRDLRIVLLTLEEITLNSFIPFGAGRRMCPGLLFGLVNVGHPLAQLLYHFDWKTPHGVTPDNFDMTETDRVTARRKKDLCLIASRFDLS
ncbi:hypothetical protein RND71_039456 [Anisodus tanguticus]|uniref:Cytochrome P450 n=1 Tax=Anisodus tanguticus TaxID=243964 RepID=A0AAE1QWI9_9SOLA|nr:hypothetical protein RND71_039456 [Anisodus tanguticus]